MLVVFFNGNSDTQCKFIVIGYLASICSYHLGCLQIIDSTRPQKMISLQIGILSFLMFSFPAYWITSWSYLISFAFQLLYHILFAIQFLNGQEMLNLVQIIVFYMAHVYMGFESYTQVGLDYNFNIWSKSSFRYDK